MLNSKSLINIIFQKHIINKDHCNLYHMCLVGLNNKQTTGTFMRIPIVKQNI